MITCYDYPMATLVEQAGIDIVLVGDSLGMTMLGYESTLPVTMNDMIRHAQAVRRGTPNGWLIGDMPYMSYQASDESAVLNGPLHGRGGVRRHQAGGRRGSLPPCARDCRRGHPGHGSPRADPRACRRWAASGSRARARSRRRRLSTARALEEAGAMAILLELVPDRVCGIITEQAKVPIIGLGSGPNAHGQLLIFHDMFGLYPRFTPKMAKQYANAGKLIGDGLKQYVAEVTGKVFPEPERYFGIKEDEYTELRRLVAEDDARVG